MSDVIGGRCSRCRFVIMVVLCLAIGCSRKPPHGKVSVAGTIVYDKAVLACPLPRVGLVQFEATDESDSGTARIAADGSFHLFLLPGRYRVAVTATEGVDTLGDNGRGPNRAPRLIPERYATARTSGIEVGVAHSQGKLTIELGK